MATLAELRAEKARRLESRSPQFFGESLDTIVSGAVAEPIAGLAGIAQTLNPFASEGAGARAVEGTREALTIQPKSEMGKRELAAVGGALAPVGEALESAEEFLGGSTLEATGSPMLAAGAASIPTAIGEAVGIGALKGAKPAARAGKQAAKQSTDIAERIFNVQTPAKQKIAQLLADNSADVSTAQFKLDPKVTISPDGKPQLAAPNTLESFFSAGVVKDQPAINAIKQGFDEGVVAAIKGGSKVDKRKMLEMTDIMEKGKRNKLFAMENRPGQVAGDTLLDKIKVVRSANRSFGKQIDEISNSLKGKDIDVGSAINAFDDKLNEFGVSLIKNKDGNIIPDFKLSELPPGDRGPIKEVVRQMNLQGAGGVDAFNAHKMKRAIDRNVTYGKVKTGLSNDTASMLKEFRTGLDDALDSTFPDYNQANIGYAETITALDELKGSVGGKLNLSGENADKALGTRLRSLMSNQQSRVNMLDSINDIEKTARKHGGGGKLLIEGASEGGDDLMRQILFADELDSVFGPVARTSFQGQIDQALKQGVNAATGQAGAIDAVAGVAGKVAEKARGINTESAFRSMRELLRE